MPATLGKDYGGTPEDAVDFTARVARMMTSDEIGPVTDGLRDTRTLDRLIVAAREVYARETG